MPGCWRRSRPTSRRSTTSSTTAEPQRADFEAQLAAANTQIATLAGRVDTLTTEKGQLESDKAALSDTVVHLTTYKNTVYYAVGTKDELMKSGVVTKEGSKFLFFGGTRLEPARNLNPDAFTAIDKTQNLRSRCPGSTRSTRSSRARARTIWPATSPRVAGQGVGGDRAARGVLVGVEVPDSGAGLRPQGSRTRSALPDGHLRVAVLVRVAASSPRVALNLPAFACASSRSPSLA